MSAKTSEERKTVFFIANTQSKQSGGLGIGSCREMISGLYSGNWDDPYYNVISTFIENFLKILKLYVNIQGHERSNLSEELSRQEPSGWQIVLNNFYRTGTDIKPDT